MRFVNYENKGVIIIIIIIIIITTGTIFHVFFIFELQMASLRDAAFPLPLILVSLYACFQ